MPIPMLTFTHPGRLWLLAVVVVIGVFYLLVKKTKSSKTTTGAALLRVLPHERGWVRRLAVLAALASLASVIVAYAQPRGIVKVPKDRATIVVAIDVSRSMMAEDVAPNRMDAAKEAAKGFVYEIPERFNVALVKFAGTAALVVPPTHDRNMVARAIDSLDYEPSTAIGEGIYQSLSALKLVPEDPDHPDDPAPASIVLLSDGSTNMGRSSEEAATEAKRLNVPVYTIAYGTSGGYVVEDGRKQFVPVDNHELWVVADRSGGQKYSADSLSSLKSVYESIRQSIGYEDAYMEVTARFAGIALILAVLAALGAISLAARWP